MHELKYSEHIISGQGVAPDPEKVNAVVYYPRPEAANQFKSFVCLIA